MHHARLCRLCRDRRGITALEYAFLAMFVALALVGVETTLGHDIQHLFTRDSAPIVTVANGIGGTGTPTDSN
ncbi:MAG: Flp family type IVb pilin [Acetobacteraceae bacterium]